MRRQFNAALVVGTLLGALSWLIHYATNAVANYLEPPPPDYVFIWLRPTIDGMLVGGLICALICGFCSVVAFHRLYGEKGLVRVRPILLMVLVWAVAPVVAPILSGAFARGTSVDALSLLATAGLCGLAMAACAEIYVTM